VKPGGVAISGPAANLRPFQPGHDPRRNITGLSAAERAFWKTVEDEHYPRASALLKAMIDKGIKGNEKCGLVAFKVMGLIRKQTDTARSGAGAKIYSTG
jgi:hypothetical protein